jgi:hypothetical protein
MKKEVKQCFHCKKKVSDNEKQVDLITSDKGKEIEHVKFHCQCWADYFNQRVINKAKEQVELMQVRALQITQMPFIREILSKIQGGDLALNMLKPLLNKKKFVIPNPKQEIVEKIEYDRNKRGKQGKTDR